MSDFDVGFVIFPGITQLDFTGPFEVLSRLATPPSLSVPSRFPQLRTHVVAKTLQPVSSDRGLRILPTCTFDNCPSLNVICVPGGAGIVDALADVETVDFIRREGGHAQFVTSVCTGAFLLGAAGLLKGRRAATHWAYVDLLPLVGASHEKGRIVRDGNVFTSGGVTSGIDFAFRIVAEVAGSEVAQAIQLAIEYDPSPNFDAGHPDKASEAATSLMVQTQRKGSRGDTRETRKIDQPARWSAVKNPNFRSRRRVSKLQSIARNRSETRRYGPRVGARMAESIRPEALIRSQRRNGGSRR